MHKKIRNYFTEEKKGIQRDKQTNKWIEKNYPWDLLYIVNSNFLFRKISNFLVAALLIYETEAPFLSRSVRSIISSALRILKRIDFERKITWDICIFHSHSCIKRGRVRISSFSDVFFKESTISSLETFMFFQLIKNIKDFISLLCVWFSRF